MFFMRADYKIGVVVLAIMTSNLLISTIAGASDSDKLPSRQKVYNFIVLSGGEAAARRMYEEVINYSLDRVIESSKDKIKDGDNFKKNFLNKKKKEYDGIYDKYLNQSISAHQRSFTIEDIDQMIEMFKMPAVRKWIHFVNSKVLDKIMYEMLSEIRAKIPLDTRKEISG